MTIPFKSDAFDVVATPHLREVTTLAGIDGLRDAWQALERRHRGELAYFQTFDWCRNWVAHIAASLPGVSPRIICVWKGAHLVALMPAMISRVAGGVRMLKALGEPHTQYAGMLTDPAGFCPETVRLLSGFFSNPGGCDAVSFDLVPAHSPLASVMPRKALVKGYDNQSSSLDLTQFASADAFIGSQGDKRIRSRRKRRNRLQKQAGELTFRVVWPGSEEFAGLVHTCVAMKKRWLAETGRLSRGFAIDGYADFLAGLTGDEASNEGAVAFVLEAAGQPVAIEVSMIRNGHLYAYIGGFDWELNKFSPGKLQMEATICWCIENGIRAYDLLGNAAAYKDDWSNLTCELLAFNRANTLRGWMYGSAWLNHVRPQLKRLFENLPAGVRQLAASPRLP
jgi:CelD/BcsL family acetyltransferase involved in cellulose biosynthesis